MLVSEALQSLQNLTEIKISQADIARILNVTPVALNKRILRGSELKVSEAEILEEHYAVKLVSGSISADDFVELDYIHINPSCGKGTIVLDEAEVTPIKIGKEIIQSVWGISNPTALKIFKASGDSMEPIIEDGNLLLVDTSRNDISNGGVYLLTINNDWFVKRIRKRLSGELDVISDNAHYPIETFNKDSFADISIMGKVVKNLSRGL